MVAYPPFSAQWSANPQFMTDERFSQYGRLEPSGKADFAFVQHMIFQLADIGTSIPTCILVFKKCRETPEDVLFIDASQHFEKVKTQNMLRDEDITKIVDTHRNRIEEPRYSKKATLAEIIANDYNLNIPRYVDTYETEERIDIDKVAGELVELDKQMAETDEVIADCCKELGISTPFKL